MRLPGPCFGEEDLYTDPIHLENGDDSIRKIEISELYDHFS